LPARRLSTRRIKEVLRLKYELGLGQRQIARSCSIGQAPVNDYLRRAEVAGLRWPLTDEWDDDRIERELFGRRSQPSTPPSQRTLPDFRSIHDQLRQHRHLTLQLLWVEYRQAHPDGYGYSHFCDHYKRWRRKLDVVLRQEHKAGEKLFVDWAGPTIPVHERTTGLVWQASLFVAVMGPVPIRTPRRLAISRWNRGFRRTSTLLSFAVVCHRLLFPITPEPASPEPAGMILT